MGAIVGRELEASAIDDFLDRAAEQPRVLVIEGAAGIGKSTLWLAAVAAARERGYVILASRPAESERQLANVVLGDLFGDVQPEQLAALPAPRRRAFDSALLRGDDAGAPVDPRALGVALVTLLPAPGYADEVREIGTAYGIEAPDDFFPGALLALHEGDFARARSLSARVLSAGDHAVIVKTHHGITGIYDLWTGDPEAAIVHFERADQSADAAASYEPHMRHWRAEHVEALLQVGRIDDATRLTDEWEKAGRRLDRKRVLALATRCRGVIAAARGDIAAAIDILEAAVARHRDVDDPFGVARAEFALGVNRRRSRQKRSAREALEAALAGFEALGASYWAAAARSELARVGGRTRSAGLSPSELSVAALVAEGRTNREIASSLFLGERTVAGHLTHIYAKLGVRSRTELARQFASKVETS